MTVKDAISCLPRKSLDCEFKVLDEAVGTFEMYALIFGNVDRQGDLIEFGAVQNVDELVEDGWIALNHDQVSLPIAMIDTALQDTRGLKLTGRFHSTPDAQNARTTILERKAAGKAVKTSIGYIVPVDGERYERINGQQVRIISKLSVYEASYVNLPANPEAEILTAKALQGTIEEMGVVMSALKTKGDYKVGGEDMERLKSAHGQCIASTKSLAMYHKAMKEALDAHTEAAGEMVKAMKSFTSGQQQDVDKENEGDVAEKPKDDEEEKPEEEEKPKDDDEEEESKSAQTLRNHLLRQELLRHASR